MAADVSGAARISPAVPKKAPAEIVTTRISNGFIRRVAPIAIGCTMFCSRPFASKTITSMISAVVVPFAPSASTTANAPETTAPTNGTYAVTNVTTAIVPASGTSSSHAPTPTTTALNAATIVVPRKYIRTDRTTRPVIVSATRLGTPRCPLNQRRSSGPSFRSMKVLKALNAMKKPSDASPLIPAARPCVNTAMMSGTDDFRLSEDAEAPDWSTPRFFSHCWNLSAAELASDAIVSDWARTPPTTRMTINAAIAITKSSTMSAPRARGTRWRWSHETPGLATVEMTSPTRTGTAIVDVMPMIQVRPTSRAATPTSSQAAKPRSRSQRGAAKTADNCLSWSASSWTTECCTSPSSCGGAVSTAVANSSCSGPCCQSLRNLMTRPSRAVRDLLPAPPSVSPDAAHSARHWGLLAVDEVDRDAVLRKPGAKSLCVVVTFGLRQEELLRIGIRRAPAVVSFHDPAPQRHEPDRTRQHARLMHGAVQVEVLGRELGALGGMDAAIAAPDGDVVGRAAGPSHVRAEARPHAVAPCGDLGLRQPQRVEDDTSQQQVAPGLHDDPGAPTYDGLDVVRRERG